MDFSHSNFTIKSVVLFAYAVVLLITLVGCCTAETDWVFQTAGVLNTLVGVWVLYCVVQDMRKK